MCQDVSPLLLLQIAVLVSISFISCWFPYGLVSLWSILRESSTIPPAVSMLPCMFAKSSTVYNPIIYYIFSQSFKKEVKQLCWGSLRCCPGQVSKNINVNSIYMASNGRKHKVAAQTVLQEISESKSVILG